MKKVITSASIEDYAVKMHNSYVDVFIKNINHSINDMDLGYIRRYFRDGEYEDPSEGEKIARICQEYETTLKQTAEKYCSYLESLKG